MRNSKKAYIFCDWSQFITSEINNGPAWMLLKDSFFFFFKYIFYLLCPECPKRDVWGQKVTVSKQLKGVIKGAVTFPLKLLPDIFFTSSWSCFSSEDSESNMFFSQGWTLPPIDWKEMSQTGSCASLYIILFSLKVCSLDTMKLANSRN